MQLGASKKTHETKKTNDAGYLLLPMTFSLFGFQQTPEGYPNLVSARPLWWLALPKGRARMHPLKGVETTLDRVHAGPSGQTLPFPF